MSELSLAAQAVLDAAFPVYDEEEHLYVATGEQHAGMIAAAALRAAADQVVPLADVAPQEDLESRREAMAWGMQHQTQLTRYQLLAIADELEAQ
jgi:hypothetical protein